MQIVDIIPETVSASKQHTNSSTTPTILLNGAPKKNLLYRTISQNDAEQQQLIKFKYKNYFNHTPNLIFKLINLYASYYKIKI